MPNLSGPNPMSLGQFNQQAAATGVGAATNGVSGLASAIAQGPMMRAQGAYLGAETGRAQAGAAAQTQITQGRQTLAAILANPQSLRDPSVVQHAAALMAADPELAGRAAQTFSTMLNANAAAGGGVAQPTADRFSAGTGVAAMGNTPTGQGLDLANRTGIANIGAGATEAAATTAANASMANEGTRQAGLDRRTLVEVNGPNGPQYAPAVQAGTTSAPAYDSAVANTIAGNNSRYAPVATANGGTGLATQQDIAKEGLTPRPTSGAEVTGAVLQNRVAPPAAVPVPPTPGPGTGTVAAPTPSPDNGPNSPIAEAIAGNAAGTPPAGKTTPADAAAINQMITQALQRMNPADHFHAAGVVSPALMQPITERFAWLYAHDATTRGNVAASVDKAVQDVVGSNGAGFERNQGYLGGLLSGRDTQFVPVPGFRPPGVGGGAPAPGPAPAPVANSMPGYGDNRPAAATGINPQQAIQEAQSAIARGANPAAVAARLRTMGLALPGQPGG